MKQLYLTQFNNRDNHHVSLIAIQQLGFQHVVITTLVY